MYIHTHTYTSSVPRVAQKPGPRNIIRTYGISLVPFRGNVCLTRIIQKRQIIRNC